MKRFFNLLRLFGFDPGKTLRTLKGIPSYIRGMRLLKRQRKASDISFRLGKLYPCFEDKYAESGKGSGDYFHQDLLVARKIYNNKPELHVDIGSRIDGFVAHVASFRKIEVFDIREMKSSIPNITFTQADLMREIDERLIGFCDSLSCLHALEHFGLGRYGDPVDFEGYLKGFDNLYKILKKNGKCYFSVPIGPQRIEFNSQRIFSVEYLLKLFEGKFRIDTFSYIDDSGDLHEDVPITDAEVKDNYGCTTGCGVFELTKL